MKAKCWIGHADCQESGIISLNIFCVDVMESSVYQIYPGCHGVKRPHTELIVKENRAYMCESVQSHFGVWLCRNQRSNLITGVCERCVVLGCPVVLGKRHISVFSRNPRVQLSEHVDS